MKTCIEGGDLLAYLEGEALPLEKLASLQKPAIQQRLQTLKQANQRFCRLFGGIGIPDPQDLVDVASGQATSAQEIRVAAYVRGSIAGQQAMAALLALEAPPPRKLPQWFAFPLRHFHSLGTVRGIHDGDDETIRNEQLLGVHASATDSEHHSFYTSELSAKVLLRTIPPQDTLWQIKGYVTQQDRSAPGVQVKLYPIHQDQASQGHPRPRIRSTDSEGFFLYQGLSPGRYRLQIRFTQGSLLIPYIDLTSS